MIRIDRSRIIIETANKCTLQVMNIKIISSSETQSLKFNVVKLNYKFRLTENKLEEGLDELLTIAKDEYVNKYNGNRVRSKVGLRVKFSNKEQDCLIPPLYIEYSVFHKMTAKTIMKRIEKIAQSNSRKICLDSVFNFTFSFITL